MHLFHAVNTYGAYFQGDQYSYKNALVLSKFQVDRGGDRAQRAARVSSHSSRSVGIGNVAEGYCHLQLVSLLVF